MRRLTLLPVLAQRRLTLLLVLQVVHLRLPLLRLRLLPQALP